MKSFVSCVGWLWSCCKRRVTYHPSVETSKVLSSSSLLWLVFCVEEIKFRVTPEGWGSCIVWKNRRISDDFFKPPLRKMKCPQEFSEMPCGGLHIVSATPTTLRISSEVLMSRVTPQEWGACKISAQVANESAHCTGERVEEMAWSWGC